MQKIIFSFIALSLLSACAVSPEDKNAPISEPREYQTGSNIPKKDRGPSDVKSISKEDAERALRNIPPSAPPAKG
ncbi:MAG: hypothetical protein JNM52_01260 [Betaproteobacteria bacterium]|nr:hypothetical protein [Betaproteobacteria bacterium]